MNYTASRTRRRRRRFRVELACSWYFTVSPTGIVHCQPAQPSEYFSIPEWISDSLNFNVVTSMNVFKYFVHRKILGSWRKNARACVYEEKRRQLASKLFFAKPLFAPDLAKAFQARHDLLSSKVLALTDPKSYQQFSTFQLQEFIDLQKLGHTTASKELETRCSDSVQRATFMRC